MMATVVVTPSDSVVAKAKKSQRLANNWVPERPNPSEPISGSESKTPSDLDI